MKKKEIKTLLKNEVEKIETPDVFNKVLSSNDELFKDKATIKAKPKLSLKWAIASFSSFIIILAFLFSLPLITFDNNVFATVSLDVNPSIELVLNKNDQVIDLISYNYDNENLILDITYKREKIEDVLEKITAKLVSQNFISNNNNFLYLTIDCSDNLAKGKLQTKIKNKLIQSCQNNQITLSEEEIEFGNNENHNGNNYGISRSKYNYLVNGWNEMTDKSGFTSFEDFINIMKDETMSDIRNYIENHK